jgi:hypothetical protein
MILVHNKFVENVFFIHRLLREMVGTRQDDNK